MGLYFWFLPALIVPVMGVRDPPAISVHVKVGIGNSEVPARESGTSLSQRQAFRQLKKVRNRKPIPSEYCTPFQFSKCAQEAEQDSVIDFRDIRDAWDCSRYCERTSECKSWMFRHEGDDRGKCWLVKTEAGRTVKELCTRHQGTVLPFNVVDQLDSCLEEEKLYQRRCKVGECDLLKPQYKIGEKKTDSESLCKFECEVKITTDPGNNCSNYQWDQETNQCNLFSINENVGARAALNDLNCRIVAGTKNMTKNEVDNCSTKNFKECEVSLEVSGRSSVLENNEDKFGANLALTAISHSNTGYWHSDVSDDNPWIAFKMEHSYKVATVQVDDRKDCCNFRFQNVEVSVGPNPSLGSENTSCGQKSYQDNEVTTYKYECPWTAEGQYIFIQKHGSTINPDHNTEENVLHVNHVKVMVLKDDC